jgi:ethanolamine utilization microcompartment shell protein EutS
MSASAVELGFLDDFLGQRVLVFVNGFWASSSLCTLKISALAVEQGFEDEFWDTRDSVFVNCLSVSSSLFAQKMSASAVELGFLDEFCVRGSWFSSTVSEPAVVHAVWRFQRQP